MTNHAPSLNQKLLANVRELLNQSRKQVFTAVNTAMVQTYWQIGCFSCLSSVEDEQQGEARAEYGKHVLKQLSESLSKEFGKGFDLTNLCKMRTFYQCFPIRDALRHELSWRIHYTSRINHAEL